MAIIVFAGPASSLPPVEVREGLVVNFGHRFYFPAGEWTLTTGEADFEQLTHTRQAGAVLRVLVSESSGTLEGAVKGLREQTAGDGSLHVLFEEPRRIAGREAADLLILRDAAAGAPAVLIRTICFVRDGHRYYFRLESPAPVYERAALDFELTVAGLKFESRFPWSK
jgi:hypothetical protein